jgi:hypothetical protein
VYRGARLTADVGRYYFGDNCTGTVWSLVVKGGEVTDERKESFSLGGLSGFGQDSAGELYLMSVSSGELDKLSP